MKSPRFGPLATSNLIWLKPPKCKNYWRNVRSASKECKRNDRVCLLNRSSRGKNWIYCPWETRPSGRIRTLGGSNFREWWINWMKRWSRQGSPRCLTSSRGWWWRQFAGSWVGRLNLRIICRRSLTWSISWKIWIRKRNSLISTLLSSRSQTRQLSCSLLRFTNSKRDWTLSPCRWRLVRQITQRSKSKDPYNSWSFSLKSLRSCLKSTERWPEESVPHPCS